MTINLDTELVASRYDLGTRMNHYTIRRDGRQWTIAVHDDDLMRHGANQQARRDHVGNLFVLAMRGKADGEQ